jgi:hypothetical protein
MSNCIQCDSLNSATGNPRSLLPLWMWVHSSKLPDSLETVTAAIVGVRYDLTRVMDLLERIERKL